MNALLQLLAGSRQRLYLSTSAGIIPAFASAWLLSGYIREQSVSPTIDLILITLWMFLCLGASYLGAVLIGDMVFPRGWREINILGRQVDATEDEDVELVGAATQNQGLPFSILVVVILGALITLTHTVSNGFMPWYAKYGYATSTLRGDNTERKVAILDQMTRAQDSRLVEYTHMMVNQLDTSDPKVKDQAIWSLGVVARRMVRSVDLMEQGQKGGAWVYDLHKYLKVDVEQRMSTMLAKQPQGATGEALIYFIGGLRTPEGPDLFLPYFKVPIADKGMALGAIQALAQSRDHAKAIPILRTLITHSDEEIAVTALWAISEIYGFGTGHEDEEPVDPQIIDILSAKMAKMPLLVQCMALETTQRLRSGAMASTLFELYDNLDPKDARCERQVIKRPFQPPLAVVTSEELREKIVKALATIAQGNSEVLTWLSGKVKDSSTAQGVRDDMAHILQVVSEREATQ